HRRLLGRRGGVVTNPPPPGPDPADLRAAEPEVVPESVVQDAPRPIPQPATRYATIGDRLFAQLVDGAVAFGLFFFLHTIIASRLGEPTLLSISLGTLSTIGVTVAL